MDIMGYSFQEVGEGFRSFVVINIHLINIHLYTCSLYAVAKLVFSGSRDGSVGSVFDCEPMCLSVRVPLV